ncbi:hypothetical protein NND09_03805 [Prevotella copri]|jgi:hypothetical protein|uniref:RiPP n=1 Tax=Segatella copri TaxID=165179 RepID=A0AAW4YFM7_9BACT|nr:hypothetical protein [Segatella copri]MCE4122317.1 hypothetical protein [Segatella copri]MCP9497685.1 hypothetical protein [Segatella copri]MCP9512470.1 hypothetical protein [Segatella copri]MCP9522582.1 hypothetical protein [Segatella copri]
MKKYVKPTIEVVQLSSNCTLLAGSGAGISADGTANTTGELPTGDAASAYSRPSYGIWGSED